MRHRRRAHQVVAVAVTVLAIAAGGCAGSSNTKSAGATSSAPAPGATGSTSATTTSSGTAPLGGPSALSVSPTSGTPRSVIRFSFTSPGAGAAQASTQISQSLSIIGPQHAGCVGQHGESVPVAPAGQPVHVEVGPAQVGGVWCAGTYVARVELLERPRCAQGMMCPQFIRVVAVLGPVTFRIAG